MTSSATPVASRVLFGLNCVDSGCRLLQLFREYTRSHVVRRECLAIPYIRQDFLLSDFVRRWEGPEYQHRMQVVGNRYAR